MAFVLSWHSGIALDNNAFQIFGRENDVGQKFFVTSEILYLDVKTFTYEYELPN